MAVPRPVWGRERQHVAAIKSEIATTVMGTAGSDGNWPNTRDEQMEPIRPTAAWIPNAVDRT